MVIFVRSDLSEVCCVRDGCVPTVIDSLIINGQHWRVCSARHDVIFSESEPQKAVMTTTVTVEPCTPGG